MDVNEGQDSEVPEASLDDAQTAVSRATDAAAASGEPELQSAASSLQGAVDALREDDSTNDEQQGTTASDTVELPPVIVDLSLNIEECKAIARMAARESDRLSKVRKGLVEDGLVAGVREVDQHIRVIGGIKAMVALQFDAFSPTPLEREIEARSLASAQREAVGAPLVGDDEITTHDGNRIAIDALIKNGENEGEFVVQTIDGRETIWHDKPSGQWRVVKDALKYPDAADAAPSKVRTRGKRGGAPTPIAATVAKVAGAAKKERQVPRSETRRAVAKATGERTHKPKPRGRPKGKRS